ncbi:hypothetical protein KXV31_006845 [Aspergillus fumigatus]|nr:hypothetical protein CNMCM8714_000726 [Aspergillus fumigatus]KAH2084101.1 hypothetical protein KXX03_002577 [Aspergillus fumigatus]KAH2157376.1 hypothetical protein KXW33_006842 [Aspergillus fumigatus]KAH2198778.1 hypothetical protein KXW61_001430 [Aspergillus fumigatus]KAH2415609.1 hypothetical protein KXV44_000804 [Aspergillus fumigatus]
MESIQKKPSRPASSSARDGGEGQVYGMGEMRELKKGFTPLTILSMAVVLMATWEALSSTMVSALVSGGPVSLVYGFILALIGALATAASLGEMASMYPTAGGQYHFIAKLAPEQCRYMISWLVGWIGTFGWVAFTASAPFLAATMIQGLVVLNYEEYQAKRWHGTLIYWALLAISAVVNIWGARLISLIENASSLIHLAAFIAEFVVIWVCAPTKHSASFVFTLFRNESGWSSNGVAWSIGYDGAIHLSEEMTNAEVAVPWCMLGSLAINGMLGFAFLLTVLFCMGDFEAALNTATGFPIIQIFYNITGSAAGSAAMTSMLIIMAGLATIPLTASTARMLWSLTRDRAFPFSTYLSIIDKKTSLPVRSVFTTSGFLVLLGLINIGSTTAFNAILSLAVLGLHMSYLIPTGFMLWRRLHTPEILAYGPWKLGKMGVVVNIVSILYLSFTCIFMVFPPYQPVSAVNMNYASLIFGGVLICTRRGYDCPGYSRPLKWSSKYEVANTELGSKSNARRKRLDCSDSDDKVLRLEVMLSHNKRQTEMQRDVFAAEEHTSYAAGKEQSSGDTVQSHLQEDDLEPNLALPIFSNVEFNDLHLDVTSSLEHELDASTSVTMLWNDSFTPTLITFEDRNTSLLRHYFSVICHINCAFDSEKNPFRVCVSDMMKGCPLIYHCVLSMSAAHLATQVLEIAKMGKGKGPSDDYASSLNLGALFGSILLGMTDGWHNPSCLGLTHLHGARVLFKHWISSNMNLNGTTSVLSSQMKSFLAGIMAYWEAVSSFLKDQPISSLSYLAGVCQQDTAERIQPNPWTGISTPLFIYLAQVGILGRQLSIIRNLSVSTFASGIQSRVQDDLLQQARECERKLYDYQVPPAERIEDTGDDMTPISHLQTVAEIYRLTALLELYRCFPGLFGDSPNELCDEFPSCPKMPPSAKLLPIATSILTLISTLPLDSGAQVLLLIPLMVAGSTLQPTRPGHAQTFIEASWARLCAVMLSLPAQESVYMHWRAFVRHRIKALYGHIGLASVLRALEVVERVWARADLQATANTSAVESEFIHWTDVMVDERLESIFG